MALFDNIRSKTDSTTARILFGAVVVVFVFSFINMGFGGRTVTYATVNGDRITDLDLQKRMRLVQRQMSSSSMNEDELKELQNSVLERLITEKAVMGMAGELGLEVSDTEIGLTILQNPGFKDAAGDFSAELYEQAIKQEGFASKSKFEERIRQDLTYTKLRDMVSNSVLVSDEEGRTIAKQNMTKLDLEWIRLSSSSVNVEVTEEDIQLELKENEDIIKEQYTADLPFEYQKPERVNIQRIVLPITTENENTVQETATTITTRLSSGESFDSLVLEYNPEAINSGKISQGTKEQLGPVVADFAFTSEINTSKIIELPNTLQIVLVLQKFDAETISYEDASPEIARALLQTKKQNEELDALAQVVQNKWMTNAFTEEESLRYRIESANEISLNDPKIPGLGNAPELFSALMGVTASGIMPTPYKTLGGLVIANVTKITKPTDADLLQSSKIESMRLKALRQRDSWAAFEIEVRSQADVQEIWKQWQQ
jgi:hypothetical protein